MEIGSRGSLETLPKPSHGRVTIALLVSWPLATGVLWAAFESVPVGALPRAPAGSLVAIRGSTVTTAAGYFQALAYPLARLGTRLRVMRANSLSSETGLQLCALRAASTSYWCDDISDGYAGALSTAAYGARAATRHHAQCPDSLPYRDVLSLAPRCRGRVRGQFAQRRKRRCAERDMKERALRRVGGTPLRVLRGRVYARQLGSPSDLWTSRPLGKPPGVAT